MPNIVNVWKSGLIKDSCGHRLSATRNSCNSKSSTTATSLKTVLKNSYFSWTKSTHPKNIPTLKNSKNLINTKSSHSKIRVSPSTINSLPENKSKDSKNNSILKNTQNLNLTINPISKITLKSSKVSDNMKINLSSNTNKSPFSNKESHSYKIKTILMTKSFTLKVLFGFLIRSCFKLKTTLKIFMTLKAVSGREFHKKWATKIGSTLSSTSSKISTKTKTLWLKRSCSWKSPLSTRSTVRKTLNDLESYT